MLNDLAALTPPLLICAAFVIAVVAFLKREMAQGDQRSDDDSADVTQDRQDLNSGD
jgi:hypothetical protein